MSSEKTIKPCPNCGSRDVEHKDVDMHRLSHSAMHVGGHQIGHAMKGHPAILLLVAGAWGVRKLAHSLSESWTCKKCGHKYS